MPAAVTLLGPDIDHRLSLQAMLGGGERKLDWVPDSNSYHSGRESNWWSRTRRKLDRFLGTRSPDYLAHLLPQLDGLGTQVVVSYWGTEPLADLLAIRRLRPRIRLVLMVLCYPIALDNAGILRQNWLMRRAAKVLDGVLFPDEAMRDYFVEHGLVGQQTAQLILPPCWPASFQAQGPQPAIQDRPNVIFTGRTDLASHTIHAADDLRPLMSDILQADTELHHVYSRETADGHPRRKTFNPRQQAELIAHMPTHDASLIAYNTAACERDDRFRLTVPDRLLSSVAAGVPVAVPSQGYTGVKQYLAGYPAVIEFDDAAHLHRQLLDRPRMQALHDQAWAARHRYAAERHAGLLASFVDRLAAL